MKRQCSSCHHLGASVKVWDWSSKKEEVRGECHRNPPIIDWHGVTRWPMPLLTDVCGEWEAKEKTGV